MEQNITISTKPMTPIHIEMDANLLTWEDMMTFTDIRQRQERKEITESELLTALGALISKVVGQDVNLLPARVVTKLFVEFTKLMSGDEENLKN